MTAQPSEPVNRAVAPSVNGWSAEYLDAMYAQYQADAASVPADVRAFMQGFDLGMGRSGTASAGGGSGADLHAERVVQAFRRHGHLEATLDPLGSTRPSSAAIKAVLDAIPADQLDTPTSTGQTVRGVIAGMRSAYCGTTGVEYLHCTTHAEREWFRTRFEAGASSEAPASAQTILQHLTISETFERWLGKRYPGKKRFSLEGAETLIPMLRILTERGGALGLREVIIGMAHRGRLNVLRHYLGKDTERLITEFEDSWSEGADQGGGDVKYHRGYSFDFATPSGNVHLSMLNNPSHLEAVNALVMGRARARQDGAKDAGRDGRREIAALLIHGDAAVIGQGVVAECVNMSYLEGYHVGGTIHLVVNNQVGFTTDIPDDRSSEYCTDLAKVIGAPVLHVNGDDPEACVRAAVMAMEYRQQFGKDVWVDLVCFRRHGHNEQDEPGYTQPEMYAKIKAHPGTRGVYAAKLAAAGTVSAAEAEAMVESEIAVLDKAQDAAKARPVNPVTPPGQGRWKGFVGSYTFDSPKTAVDVKVIEAVCAALGRVPEGFNVHPKLRGLLESRSNLPKTKKLNHADAEQVAFGTLLWEGTPIRLSGQDSRRGTFSSRHAVLRDEKTGERVTPLNGMKHEQAKLDAWDSPLSEYSVMGFDYGYSRANPHALVIWEGQFGDFCNTAQVVIDQFMASSEVKWDRWAGLVLMLPHGYEGQGPEHSSARLERFLQLCADDNMEVVYPSTGAQVFHMLRRHVKRNFRKPLVVMTPKKFLRVETATIDELTSGEFRHLIDDPHVKDAAKVTKVVYCSGKIYHELHERREATKRGDLAIVRVEQLYPFHTDLAKKIDTKYPKAASRVWAQEEPRNQGAFLYAADVFREKVGVALTFVGRDASASPATGSEYAHKKQQEKILSGAVGPLDGGGQPAKPMAPTPNGSPVKSVPTVTPAGKQTVKSGR
jgi:2-oxoglutarate dehydrogenase E1 component